MYILTYIHIHIYTHMQWRRRLSIRTNTQIHSCLPHFPAYDWTESSVRNDKKLITQEKRPDAFEKGPRYICKRALSQLKRALLRMKKKPIRIHTQNLLLHLKRVQFNLKNALSYIKE